MCQTSFSLAQSPRLSVPYYWRSLLIGGRYRYLHRRAVLYPFCFYICYITISSETSPCGNVGLCS